MSLRRLSYMSALVVIVALSLPVDAYARAGMGFSFGNRGSHSFSAPPTTSTAPRPAAPLERYSSPSPGYAAPAAPRTGFFQGSFGRGLIGGLLGAGLFGLLFGNGFFGGLGNGMSFIGLLIQLGLVFLIVRFVMSMFRRQTAPAFSTASSFGGPGAMSGGRSYAPSQTAPLPIETEDFNIFQQRLAEVQAAYGAEDIEGLRRLATPEMAAHFAQEISANGQRGVVNRLSDVRLLQGDLAEAWREAGAEFATVAMRYSIVDVNVDRASGRLVAGSSTQPQEVTELWTFVRPVGSGPESWRLSAIQQA